MILQDLPAERAILAGVLRHGSDAYFDIADIVDENSFTIESNMSIYCCLKHVIEKDDTVKPDIPLILSAAKEIGLSDFFNNQEVSHLASIAKFPVLLSNVRGFAAKVRKLQIARMMYDQLELTKEKYTEVKGDEPISQILGIAEESIFDFTSILSDSDEAPSKMFEDVEDYLKDLAEDPIDQIGISTGFNRYDFAIGGGLRRGTVNVIGARPKTGKTLLADNMGVHIARQGIPVLNLDTEMRKEDHQNRMMAMLSDVEINDIETGKFSQSPLKNQRVLEAAKEIKDIPYYFKSIGGMSFEDQISIMRRWIAKVVGVNDKGKANDCVIIYDYLKLMDSAAIKSDMKEFQVLGFMMTSLHNFALRYEVPVLSFIQLNRDGINKETTDTASGSDRIIWLCSNFSIYKYKSDEEIAKDGPENGNRKLVPVISRHGEGLEDKDYINIMMNGSYARISEGKTAFELEDNTYENEPEQYSPSEDIPFV
jgi:replicative DNA helicase|tara:strand:- start:475 stop:1917 length:1443 start_codon:yes stop_codon:yes gene_type:complete